MSFGKELIQSANEALEIAQGKAKPAAFYVPKPLAPPRTTSKKSPGRCPI